MIAKGENIIDEEIEESYPET